MKFILFVCFLIIGYWYLPSQVTAAPPQIVGPISVSPPNSQVQVYQKIEWAFDLSKSYPNPYYYYDASDTPANNPSRMSWFGIDGITVNAVITLPDQTTVTVPAFYYQDFARVIRGDLNILGRKNKPVWMVRYAAGLPGTYSIFFTAQDKDGTTQSTPQNFSVTSGTNPGFVRVNPNDPRYLIFDNGTSFVPNARGNAQGDNYESRFVEFQQHGVNLIRIWDQMDYRLGVEGANNYWLNPAPIYNWARGVTVNSNTHSGIRAAQPTNPWYQRVVVSQPSNTHKLILWTDGNITASVRYVDVLPGSPIVSQTFNSTSYTQREITHIPNENVVAIYFEGSGYVDDISYGPTDAQGNLLYDLVSDGGLERHFAKDLPGSDPNSDPTLPRPLGNYFNQDEAWLQDQYISVAEQTGVKIQLCSCSGPWFTWPGNPEQPDGWDWSAPWVLKSWQRNFRYRVARWGYSTAILAWENHNEHGHLTPSDAEYAFYQNYGAYQQATDPYHHLRTTSQGSQAFSGNLWSTGAFDLINYHDYMMINRYGSSLTNDEANFIHRFAWCLSGKTTNPTNDDYGCVSDLGIGDGTNWLSGVAKKPFIWGEIGVGTTVWNEPNPLGTTGEGARRVHHNTTWAGLFSPMATVPINWYDDIDNTSTNGLIYAERLIASQFFNTINFSTSLFTHLMTAADTPTGYTGETISSNNANARVYALRSQDKNRLYAWVQHRDYTWANSPNLPTTISPVITFSNLPTVPYVISTYNTYTGATTTISTTTPTNGQLNVSLNNLQTDIALKIEANSPPPPLEGDLNQSGQVDFMDILYLLPRFAQYNIFTFNTIISNL